MVVSRKKPIRRIFKQKKPTAKINSIGQNK